MDKVKVGFIGAGGNAGGHMEQVNGIEGAQIVATCDVMKERADERAVEYGAKAYTDHRAMLEQVEMANIEAFLIQSGSYIDASKAEMIAEFGSVEDFIRGGLGLSQQEVEHLRDELLV